MSEDIKALLEKINQEGVIAAEAKAKEITEQAASKASQIIKTAKLEAERILADAKEAASRMREKEKSSLVQAGRDLLLGLKQEVNALLQKVIAVQIKETLSTENLAKILNNLIHESLLEHKAEIIITLNKDDLRALEHGFFAKLKEQAKKKIILRAADDIAAGFVISFDVGKSQFDFSDKSLAEYIGGQLKPKLKEILER